MNVAVSDMFQHRLYPDTTRKSSMQRFKAATSPSQLPMSVWESNSIVFRTCSGQCVGVMLQFHTVDVGL